MKKLLCSIFAVLVLLSAGSMAFAAEPTRFDGKVYNMTGDLWVVEEVPVVLTSGQGNSTVRLISLKPEGSDLNERFWLEVRPPADAPYPTPYIVELPRGIRGYNPRLEVSKFVVGERQHGFLVLETVPGGPRQFAVLELQGQRLVVLFDSMVVARAILSGNYIGQYKVMLHVYDTGTDAILDVSPRKSYYQSKGVYNSRGDILETVSVSAYRYRDVSIGQRDADGVSQLNAVIDLYGYDGSDHIAIINCTMRYDSNFGFWKLTKSEFVPDSDIGFWTKR